MNDYNQEQRNEQVPAPGGEPNVKQENVYTVGAGYGQQTNASAANTQQTQNNASAMQNPQPQAGYTAPSGNTYTYSANTPPYGQPNGYYGFGSAPQPPKKKKGKGGVIALAVAGCLLLSLLMGLGGAAVALVALDYQTEQQMQPSENNDTPQDSNDAQGGLNMEQSDNNPVFPGANSDSHLPQSVTIKKNTGTSVITTSGQIGDEDLSYADVVALVKDSVVEITTNYVVSGTMFSQYVSSGAGSGVIFAQEGRIGYIVTNNHVVEGATSIKVRLSDGTELDAKMVGTDSATDLAVLTVDTELTLNTASLGNSDNLIVGQEVIAIGNPLGQLGGTVTNGIVSALEREVTIDGENMTLLQTNAAVNPGNSGGGLFNMRGELIGVVNAKSSGDDVEGLGFAIPANTVYEIITELIEYGYVRGRPALGITVSVARQQYFMQVVSYIYVTDPGKTQLQVNDILYAIEGKEIASSDDITAAISGKTVGDTVEIVVLRNNKEVKVTVELIEYVPEGAQS